MNHVTVGRNIYPGYILPLSTTGSGTDHSAGDDIKMFRLIFAESGTGMFSINGRQVLLTAPFLMFLDENDVAGMPPESEIAVKSVYFHPSVLNDTFDYDNLRNPQHPFSVTEQQDRYLLHPFLFRNEYYGYYESVNQLFISNVSDLYRDLEAELVLQKDNFWPCRSRSFFIELLILISRYFGIKNSIYADYARPEFDIGISGDNTVFSDNTRKIKHISELSALVNYLQANYMEKITVQDLAKTFNTNRTTLNQRFKSITGMTLIDYLITYRINLASVLLRNTELTISEIQERSGFSTSTHFWRMFKKHTGLSPTEYRQKHCLHM
jgi:AraC-like DNA-binding protein